MSKLIAAAALAALALPGWAQKVPSVSDRIAVRNAQVQLIKADTELERALQEQAGASLARLPVVYAVMGLDGAMQARLYQSNGVVNNYKVGDSVRPGMRVASITPREVWVEVGSGKQTRALPLEFKASSAGDTLTPQPGGLGMPGGRPPVPRELLPAAPEVALPGSAPEPVAAAPAAAAPVPAAKK